MKKRVAGFSLAEMIISLLILAVLSVIMLGVVPASIFGIRSAQQRATATMLAQDLLETLRSRSFASLPVVANGSAGKQTIDSVEYETLYSVTVPPETSFPRDQGAYEPDHTCLILAKKVEVIVRWRARQGRTQLVASTVLARR